MVAIDLRSLLCPYHQGSCRGGNFRGGSVCKLLRVKGNLGAKIAVNEFWTEIYFERALPWGVMRCSLARVIFLMNSTRRKRRADQSSSMATARTGSKPAWPRAC